MSLRTGHILFSTAAILAAVLGMAQQPFDLDPSFRTAIQQDYVSSVLPLPDGKVIASGTMRFPSDLNYYNLVRLNADGSLDGSFYDSGLGDGKITPWTDGKFYVGTYGSETVRKILPDGHQDPTFIEMNAGPYFESGQGGDYYVYPDGRVLMTGLHLLEDTVRGFVGLYSLIWFSNTGYLDTTAQHRRSNGPIYHIAHLSDEKFILSGEISVYEGSLLAISSGWSRMVPWTPPSTARWIGAMLTTRWNCRITSCCWRGFFVCKAGMTLCI